MLPLKHLLTELKAVFRPARMARDLDEEMRLHLELETEANLRRGLSAGDARYAALKSFGGVEQHKELCRETYAAYFMNSLLTDLRICFRRYLKHPGYAAIVVATIAVCVALNTSMFSLLNSLRFNPRLYPGDDRIVRVFDDLKSASSLTRRAWSTSVVYYLERREQATQLESIGLFANNAHNIGYGDPSAEAEYLQVAYYTPSMFDVLRVRPALGRAFNENDAASENDAVSIITHEWWRARYHSAPDILERHVEIDGRRHRIVGVMPEGFQTPPAGSNLQYPEMNIIAPFVIADWQRQIGSRLATHWGCFARLKPGASPASLEDELNRLNAQNGPQYPVQHDEEKDRDHRTRVWTLGQDLTRDIGPQLYVLQTAMALIFLMGSVNVASLVLSHNSKRAYELSVRLALGGSRGRIVRQLFTEIFVLAVAGGALGLALTVGALQGLEAIGVLDAFLVMPRLGLDPETFAVAFGLAGLAAITASLGSSLVVIGRRNLDGFLRENSRAGSDGGRFKHYRGALVLVQVVSAFVLLVGGGLLLKSFSQVLAIDPGFNPVNILTATVRPPGSQFDASAFRSTMFRLEDALKTLPGVEAVGLTNWPPMKMNSLWEGFLIKEGEPPRERYPVCAVDTVNADFFSALGIPLLRGRMFDLADVQNRTPVALIDRLVADAHFGNEDPIGRRIALPRATGGSAPAAENLEWVTIVGVVEPIKTNDLYQTPIGVVYRNYAEYTPFWYGLVIKTTRAPLAILPAAQQALSRLAPGVAFGRVETMEAAIAKRYADRKGLWILTVSMGVLALALSLLGLYGIVSYSIASQTKEFGIRLALGAGHRTILRQAMGYWTKVSLLGIAAGLPVALLLSPHLQGLLYNVSPFDLSSYGAVAAFLVLALTLVIYGSARAVTRVDLTKALRND